MFSFHNIALEIVFYKGQKKYLAEILKIVYLYTLFGYKNT
ncbi:hypothetical protein RA0C_1349 [Riemerella anatipestifer ATCC 11845 = DSM 15868]|uniref:Uncharacterized protein n=1 Tax=Riemerella anatipestifer (strain ATCC 11845 / DSM 15868 / JCM 9532 / NCTC 11014) TaxID=693978 RepID=H8MAX5_RIEAD|nr:hypothetical protein RA0C_1349 [Riemerella anatipestifer ATCC 11845 = DSM 15868]AGC39833.1 hypothetical protein G148_0529 [Riemerella anatipestifer RA-CH-2]AKP71351.1 hypothetical protein CG09_1150 [Riemerella anatipestifer]